MPSTIYTLKLPELNDIARALMQGNGTDPKSFFHIVSVGGAGLRTTAFDGDVGISMVVAGKVEGDPFEILAPPNFKDALDNEGQIKIDLTDTQMKVKAPNLTCNMALRSAADYPDLPNVKSLTNGFEIGPLQLDLLLDLAEFADPRASNTIAWGVFLSWEDDQVRAYATDGFVLTRAVADARVKEAGSAFIPAKAVKVLKELLAYIPDNRKVKCGLKDSLFVFKETNDRAAWVNTINEPFPAETLAKHLDAFDREWKGLFAPSVVIAALAKLDKLTSASDHKLVRFQFGQGKQISAYAENGEMGDSQIKVPVIETDGTDDLEATYNLRYIKAALALAGRISNYAVGDKDKDRVAWAVGANKHGKIAARAAGVALTLKILPHVGIPTN